MQKVASHAGAGRSSPDASIGASFATESPVASIVASVDASFGAPPSPEDPHAAHESATSAKTPAVRIPVVYCARVSCTACGGVDGSDQTHDPSMAKSTFEAPYPASMTTRTAGISRKNLYGRDKNDPPPRAIVPGSAGSRSSPP